MTSSPQTGIFALGTSSHAYLEFDLDPSADARAACSVVAGMREPRTTIGGVNVVVGFRPELWSRVAPGACPDGVAGFNEPVVGPDGFALPATQHDVVIWLSGSGYDVVFDLSREVVRALTGSAALASELVGWPYHHDLDLTGFIDGTENPSLVEAAALIVVADGSPGAGGSVLLLQQWEHDADAWEGLETAHQEAVIGRRKPDSVELEPNPASSHVTRTDQERLGKILRRNIAYGSVTTHGTIFVGFGSTQRVLADMLGSMVGCDGPRDELTRFTIPRTGAYYFVPSSEDLARIGPRAVELEPGNASA